MDNETPKRGRPAQPFEARLAAALGFEPDLTNWPQSDLPCWPGPRLIHYEGRMVPTPRACLSHILGQPLHASHRLSQTCFGSTRGFSHDATQECVNPHHRRIVQINRSDGTPVEPLPSAAFGQYLAEQADQSDEDEINDAADWIVQAEGLDTSIADLAERCGHVYSPEILEKAQQLARTL